MREALWLVSIGLAIGVPIALGSDRVISSTAVGLTLAVAALAGYISARRATKVDPIVALGYE